MPVCKECKEVVGAIEMSTNGICKSCNPTQDAQKENPSYQKQKEQATPLEDIYGIASFVVAILGLFGFAIIFAPLALFLALSYSKKSILAKIAIGLASLELAFIAIYFIAGISLISH